MPLDAFMNLRLDAFYTCDSKFQMDEFFCAFGLDHYFHYAFGQLAETTCHVTTTVFVARCGICWADHRFGELRSNIQAYD